MYPELAPPGIAYWPFVLFMATAVAVTALAVMARILKDSFAIGSLMNSRSLI
jgi:hypothetical protein